MKNSFTLKLLPLLFITMCSTVKAEELRDPEELFNSFCFSCHGTGWEDAPVVGDSYVWEERLEKGVEVLLKHTIEGLNSMPPKGTCMDCSSDELKAIVIWMSE